MAEIEARLGTIDEITTGKIRLHSVNTGFKWDDVHSSYQKKNYGLTVTNDDPDNHYVALASRSYVVGTDVDKIEYAVYTNSDLYVGVATADKAFVGIGDSENFLVKKLEGVSADSSIIICIKKTRLEITHGTSLFYVNLEPLDGQTVHPVLITEPGSSVTVSISSREDLCLYVDKNGVPRLDATKGLGKVQPVQLVTGGGGVSVDSTITVEGDIAVSGNVTGSGGSTIPVIDDAKSSTTTTYSSDKVETLVAESGGGGGGDPFEDIHASFTGSVFRPYETLKAVRRLSYSPTYNKCITMGFGGFWSEIYMLDNDLNLTETPIPADDAWATAWLEGAGVFIAVANEGTGVYRSTDGGATWTAGTPLPATSYLYERAFIEAYGKFYVFAYTGTNFYVTADGGLTWTTQTCPSMNWIEGMAYNPDSGVIIGTGDGSVAPIYSTDGLTWNRSSGTNVVGINLTQPGYGGGTFVVGVSEFEAAGDTRKVFYSTDGNNWSVVVNDNPTWNHLYHIDYITDLNTFIARDSDSVAEDNYYYTSPDGQRWTKQFASHLPNGEYLQYIEPWGMIFADQTYILNRGHRFYHTKKIKTVA